VGSMGSTWATSTLSRWLISLVCTWSGRRLPRSKRRCTRSALGVSVLAHGNLGAWSGPEWWSGCGNLGARALSGWGRNLGWGRDGTSSRTVGVDTVRAALACGRTGAEHCGTCGGGFGQVGQIGTALGHNVDMGWARFPLPRIFQLNNYFSKYFQSSKFEITKHSLPHPQKIPNLAC
jgi:hypothetical protein